MDFALVSHTFTDCYCLARINIASYRISRNFFIANIIRVEGTVLARAPFVCWIQDTGIAYICATIIRHRKTIATISSDFVRKGNTIIAVRRCEARSVYRSRAREGSILIGAHG